MGRSLVPAVLAAVLLGITAGTTTTEAKTVCGPRDVLAASLDQRHAETPTAMGLSHDGTVVEVFAAPEGSWSIVVTRPDGVSCLLATGLHWEALPKPPAEASS